MHIRALEGRDRKSNRLILEALAFNNSLIKWEIHKAVKKFSWTTISRRVDDLKKRGYIMETGKRRIVVAKRDEDTSEYGLTWKGFVACLYIRTVRENIIEAIKNNLHIEPLNKVWSIVKEVWIENDIKYVVEVLLNVFKSMPIELESANEIQFFMYFMAAMVNIDQHIAYEIIKKLYKLKESPTFLKYIYETIEEREKELKKALKQFRKWKLEIEKLLESEV